jgi:hypothetical protein
MWDASARPSLARRQRHRPLTGTIIGHVHYMGPTPVNPIIRMGADPRYAPRLVAARVGQTLRVRNDDPTDHNVHASSVVGNDFNTTQPIKSMPFEFVTVASIVTHWRQWSAFHTDGRATPRIGTGGS